MNILFIHDYTDYSGYSDYSAYSFVAETIPLLQNVKVLHSLVLLRLLKQWTPNLNKTISTLQKM